MITAPPIVLSAQTIPTEGTHIMYAGLAWYGEDFGDHGPIACRLRVDEHTDCGFYVTVAEPGHPRDEAFVVITDDFPGRYFLLDEMAS